MRLITKDGETFAAGSPEGGLNFDPTPVSGVASKAAAETWTGTVLTDGTNYVIVQQFSKVRKTVTLRSYQDFSAQTALLKIKFLGTKNA